MPTPLRRRLRLARRGAWYVLAIGLVLMALVASIVSQLLPLAAHHPRHVADWLSARVGRPVTFDGIETQWTRRGPLLRLDNMRVGEGRQAIVIGDAEMLIAQYSGLLPGRSFTELRLRGLDLTVEQGADGRWTVHGLPGQQQAGADPFDAFEGLGELQVINGKLTVIAPALAIRARLPRVDVRLRVDGTRLRAGVRAWAAIDAKPVDGVLDINRRTGDGRAYVAARNADLSRWTPLLHAGAIAVSGGSGNVQAWGALQRHAIASVTVDANLQALHVLGAPLRAEPVSGMAATSRGTWMYVARVQARGRWRAIPGGWRIDAQTLRIGAGKQAQSLDGLVVAGGRQRALLADNVMAGPLLQGLVLSDAIAPGLREWLLAARPQARVDHVVIAGNRNGALRVSAHLDALGWGAPGGAPGISGLSGQLEGDAHGASFRFGAQPVHIDWPRGFGSPRMLSLDGQLVGWNDGTRWRVETPALRVSSGGIAATVRGGLSLARDASDPDARGPRIDLVAALDDFPVVAAKHYWVHNAMSPAVIRWLDAALMGGRVQDARVLLSGNLADWPFAGDGTHAAPGVFKATAHLQDAMLKFDSLWPSLDHANLDLAFSGDGFSVGGRGVLAGVGIRRLDAGITHVSKPELIVQAQGGGDASRLLDLVKHSPLHAQYADTIDNLGASGLAAVTFGLQLPMGADAGPGVVDGTVAFAGASLSERRWKLAFNNVRGRVAYGSGGFAADKLAVVRAGLPGLLSLRAGAYTQDPRQGFEADLQAALSAGDLADRAPALAWLKPHLHGRSTWTVGVTIPRSVAGATATEPSHLLLRSNLVGTSLDLPAPLHKPAAAALPTTIDAALPLGAGDIRVSLGNLIAVRARSSGTGRATQTGVRVVLGSSVVNEQPPASGLIATGHAGTLDGMPWIAIAKGGGRTGAPGIALRGIDLDVDHLLLLGATFPSTRLQVQPAQGATSVQLQGDALAGSMRIPDGSTTVSGRFERVHWQGAPATGASPGSSPRVDVDIDPARLPPIAIDVADLRIGNAALGSATLRTQPVAGGLHVAALQIRGARQRIDVHGDWLGQGASAHTRLALLLDSDDIGALLSGFGYGGQLAGGHGTLNLDAGWAGTPADFRLASIRGSLALAIRDGQLTAVDPGAGRVLGLLSLTQLPRRLSLDFHDFFSKGFAFDKLVGNVRLGEGQAHSDNLVIDGPAAEIRIRGTADLVAQQYDQTILVLPKAGNLLTAVGAIAGGPVGAAIGAAANAMLKKPLGRLAARTYRVTGPWKQPKVEVIGREQSRAESSQPSPAG